MDLFLLYRSRIERKCTLQKYHQVMYLLLKLLHVYIAYKEKTHDILLHYKNEKQDMTVISTSA